MTLEDRVRGVERNHDRLMERLDHLATRAEVLDAFATLRAELRGEMVSTRSELRGELASLSDRMNARFIEQLRWMMVLALAIIAVVVTFGVNILAKL